MGSSCQLCLARAQLKLFQWWIRTIGAVMRWHAFSWQRCMLPYQHDSFAGCLRKKNSQQFCDPAPAVQTVACLANKNAIWVQFEWKEAGLSVLVPSSCLICYRFRFRCATVRLRLLIISLFWSYQGFARGHKCHTYTIFCVCHFRGVLEPMAVIIGRCSSRAKEFLQALAGQCPMRIQWQHIGPQFRKLRGLLHVTYSR